MSHLLVPSFQEPVREGDHVLTPPIEPMLAQARETLPRSSEVRDPLWQQKADSYRCLAFLTLRGVPSLAT
ncbi:hypothetical protein GCM10018966_093680 [Streptomyces yanii]